MPPVGASVLVDLAGIDAGIIARPGKSSILLMPHGGPRIRQLLTEAVCMAGARLLAATAVDPCDAWPEARTLIEACTLDALSRTESPRAIDLLLAQPRLHEEARASGWEPNGEDEERARFLHRLIDPPLIAIVGRPNVGKSTLLNRLAGRELAITADSAGTTRDTVAARIELDGVACDFVDLPGDRTSDDPIEVHAITLSQSYLREADLVLALIEPGILKPPDLERKPDLIVCNKADIADIGFSPEELLVSALTGEGIEDLALALRRILIPEEAIKSTTRPWLFHRYLMRDC